MKMSNKEIYNWYIKTFHPNYYHRNNFKWYLWCYGGKSKLAKMKEKEPYRIFDEMMCWCEQSEGYEYWLCESLKLTYLCFIINKNADAFGYLQDLVDRAKHYIYDKEIKKVITQIKKELYFCL